jgi:hypothetical protein
MELFKRFLRDESGATAIEYGLIAAGISVAIHHRREQARFAIEVNVRDHHVELGDVSLERSLELFQLQSERSVPPAYGSGVWRLCPGTR